MANEIYRVSWWGSSVENGFGSIYHQHNNQGDFNEFFMIEDGNGNTIQDGINNQLITNI